MLPWPDSDVVGGYGSITGWSANLNGHPPRFDWRFSEGAGHGTSYEFVIDPNFTFDRLAFDCDSTDPHIILNKLDDTLIHRKGAQGTLDIFIDSEVHTDPA